MNEENENYIPEEEISIDSPSPEIYTLEETNIVENTIQSEEIINDEQSIENNDDSISEEQYEEPEFSQIDDYEQKIQEEKNKQTDDELKSDNSFTYTTFDKKTLIIILSVLAVLYVLYIYFTYIM